MNFFYRNFNKQYPTVSSAQGVWIWDKAGNKYLDASSGAIVSNIGHGVDKIGEAVGRQMKKIAFAHSSQFVSESGLMLAERLAQIAGFPKGRVYFTSGGSESVETALKMARSYHLESGANKKTLCISRRPSYHGSTFGALAVTGHPARRQPYEPMLNSSLKELNAEMKFVSAPYPYRCICGSDALCDSFECAEKLASEIEQVILSVGPENVMAFIGEPVIGASMGSVAPHEAYWQAVRKVCTRFGVLLIADEVMTGLGRIGERMGLDCWGVKADIVALGKGLAAGYLPLGAVIASDQVARAFEEGSGVFEHGFTYSGHPVTCAAGLAVLDYLAEHQLIERVKQREKHFFDLLSELSVYDFVGDIRGRGFLAGIELVRDRQGRAPFPKEMRLSQTLAREAAAFGLIVYPGGGFLPGGAGDHIMIAPPFNISEDELAEMQKRLNMTFSSVSQSLYSIS